MAKKPTGATSKLEAVQDFSVGGVGDVKEGDIFEAAPYGDFSAEEMAAHIVSRGFAERVSEPKTTK